MEWKEQRRGASVRLCLYAQAQCAGADQGRTSCNKQQSHSADDKIGNKKHVANGINGFLCARLESVAAKIINICNISSRDAHWQQVATKLDQGRSLSCQKSSDGWGSSFYDHHGDYDDGDNDIYADHDESDIAVD